MASEVRAVMVGAMLLATALGAAGSVGSEMLWPPRGQETRDRVWSASRRIQRLYGWEHFDRWADRVAWGESRWNPRAGSFTDENAARGIFQIRPTTRDGGLLAGVPLWGPPELQVAIAADAAARLIDRWGARTWADVRAGWAYPRLASLGEGGEDERRDRTERKWFGDAVDALGPAPQMDRELLGGGPRPSRARLVAAALGRRTL